MSPSSPESALPPPLADMTVQVTMPAVIISTEAYLVAEYRLPSSAIPISMLAIRLPARNIMCRGIGMLKLRA